MSLDAFTQAANLAIAKGKGFAYTIGIAQSRYAENLYRSIKPTKDPRYDHTHHAVVEPA